MRFGDTWTMSWGDDPADAPDPEPSLDLTVPDGHCLVAWVVGVEHRWSTEPPRRTLLVARGGDDYVVRSAEGRALFGDVDGELCLATAAPGARDPFAVIKEGAEARAVNGVWSLVSWLIADELVWDGDDAAVVRSGETRYAVRVHPELRFVVDVTTGRRPARELVRVERHAVLPADPELTAFADLSPETLARLRG